MKCSPIFGERVTHLLPAKGETLAPPKFSVEYDTTSDLLMMSPWDTLMPG